MLSFAAILKNRLFSFVLKHGVEKKHLLMIESKVFRDLFLAGIMTSDLQFV